MPEKDPFTYTIATYIAVAGLSCLAGIAAFIQKAKQKLIERGWWTLLDEIVISEFAGVTTFFLCEYKEVGIMLECALILVSAHLGSDFIIQIERLFMTWLVKVSQGGVAGKKN